jgi:hypothetical protein
MRHTCTRVLGVVALAGLLSSPVSTASVPGDHAESRGSDRGGRVDPKPPRPLAEYKGLTAGEWLAMWWQSVFATPVEKGSHPVIDGGPFGWNNRTLFVGGPVLPAGSPKVTIRVTVPAGTHVVIPIITVECSVAEAPPFHGENEAELRVCANGLLDEVADPSAKIDGRPLENPEAYRVDTPLFRYGPLTADNVLGLPPGTQSDAVGAGYVLLLPPFSVGVHRIRVRATVPAFGIAVDAETIITVESPRER